MVAEVVENRSGQHDAEPAADSEQPRDERDPACNAFRRELVADDPVGEREDCATDALDGAGGDQDGERRRECGDQRAAGQAHQGYDERALLAEHVAKTTGDRRRDGRGEQIGREHPRHACRRRIEIVLQRRERGYDEGLQHRVGGAPEGEHGEHDARTRSSAVCHLGTCRQQTTNPTDGSWLPRFLALGGFGETATEPTESRLTLRSRRPRSPQ